MISMISMLLKGSWNRFLGAAVLMSIQLLPLLPKLHLLYLSKMHGLKRIVVEKIDLKLIKEVR